MDDFFKYQAQTTPHPLALKISYAKGSYIYDIDGQPHLDFIAGVSACTLGHCYPAVVEAVTKQAKTFMHLMVYGEFIYEPALEYAKLLASVLPDPLDNTYLVNSGTEAMEGALKLARRYTGRSELIAAKNAYHGNTMGSLSLMDYEERKTPFKPLIPDVRNITFNSEEDISLITSRTAAVVLETIQGGAGIILPENNYLKKIKNRCKEVGALLILDEIQPGFGRTGKLFAFEYFDVVPDILVMGKGMASGLPVGAFTASHEIMHSLMVSPSLGHITTFGGNAVIAAAALATLKELLDKTYLKDSLTKEELIRKRLQHPKIQEIRGKGLMLALILESESQVNDLIKYCARKNLILFWLLFEKKAVRITPPLTISNREINLGCDIILEALEAI